MRTHVKIFAFDAPMICLCHEALRILQGSRKFGAPGNLYPASKYQHTEVFSFCLHHKSSGRGWKSNMHPRQWLSHWILLRVTLVKHLHSSCVRHLLANYEMQQGGPFKVRSAVQQSCSPIAPIQSQQRKGKVNVSCRLQDNKSVSYSNTFALCTHNQQQHTTKPSWTYLSPRCDHV